MPKIAYDFEEAGESGDFVTPLPGRYLFEFVKAESSQSKANNPIVVMWFKIVRGTREGFDGGLVSQRWNTTGQASGRLRNFLQMIGALKGDKKKGASDLAKFYGTKFGATVTLREGDSVDDDGNPVMFVNLGGLMSAKAMNSILNSADDEDEEEYDEEEEDEEHDDEEEDEEHDDEEEDEEDEDEDEDEDDEEDDPLPDDPDDLEDLTLAQLKEGADAYGVSTDPDKGKSKVTKRQLINRLLAEVYEADDEEEEDEEDEEEDEGGLPSADEVKSWDLDELKEFAGENDISTRKPKGKNLTKTIMRKRVLDWLAAQDGDDDEEDEEEPF